ncbi:hypothetical protein QVD17_04114 [Tagetes erecta]|uniref:Uncharacterized protein n=1 Tax=Tagetes erecta TaxID=13708 RepID=A0AAD8LBB6_TARER|nr:hypothetical protein QVD17_04114 [Tagetes erecta]
MEITEVLSSSSVDLILDQPSPFVNLKSLKVYPERECQGKRAPKKVTMSTKLKSFLLDSSPGSTFTMVSREEVEAQKLMDEVRVLLEKTNGKSKTNRAQLEQGKTIVGSHEHKKLKIGEKMVDIMSGCENTGLQLSQRIENTRRVLSKLQRMTVLLTKLPASKSAKFQTCISSLYAEVGDILNHLKDCLNFQEQS